MRAAKDESYMRECLRLAQRGEGFVFPNPMVGAVLVKRGRIIARGYHRRCGAPHAEAEALSKAGKAARGATLYVNLEPCTHTGRTPPCVEAILRAGTARVVCATRDPNALARGGIQKLRRAGVSVSLGVLKEQARELNKHFYTFHEKRRPFVSLKSAMSLDGKLATHTHDSKWITGRAARAHARALRGAHHAILVGIETVLADDPHLGTRSRTAPDPLRIILDSTLRIPLRAKVLRDKNVILATTHRASSRKKKLLEHRGIRVLVFRGEHVPLKKLLVQLQAMQVTSVLVEGGGDVLGSFLDAKIVDTVHAFYAPIMIGGTHAVSLGGRGARTISDAVRFRVVSVERFGKDLLVVASSHASIGS